MIIGIPKEIKDQEYRVGLVPSSVRELIEHGHQVFVEKDAGIGIGFTDQDYQQLGASIVNDVSDIFQKSDLIIKVKEPQPDECRQLRQDQVLFTFLHLAPDPQQAQLLQASGCTAIAYETVTDDQGGLPLLAPMSQVAGRVAIQAGAHSLEKAQGGSGVLLSGVPGVAPGKVSIIGGGVVGTHAAKIAVGCGADVTLLDKSMRRLEQLNDIFGNQIRTIYSTHDAIEHHVAESDLVIGAVLITGAQAPKLITKDMLANMRKGSVIVDVAIDQGGCCETSKPTTHQDPIYTVDGIIHYCVANMPSAVARTAALALNNVTLPFVIELANKGYKQALLDNHHLRAGLNVHKGKITHKAVAVALEKDFIAADDVL